MFCVKKTNNKTYILWFTNFCIASVITQLCVRRYFYGELQWKKTRKQMCTEGELELLRSSTRNSGASFQIEQKNPRSLYPRSASQRMWFAPRRGWLLSKLKFIWEQFLNRNLFCPMSESLNGKREGSQDNAIHKKGSLLLTQVRAFCRNQRSGAWSEKP